MTQKASELATAVTAAIRGMKAEDYARVISGRQQPVPESAQLDFARAVMRRLSPLVDIGEATAKVLERHHPSK